MTNVPATVDVDREAVLRSLNLNPSDPKTQALLLVCERYGLDPLLKHMILIQGNPYVTRDGYLAIAHRSGQFDGMEVLEQGEDKTHYTARVAVYRKDMRRPFTYIGRFPKSKNMAKDYGPEMAIKVAEVQALRRAFNVTGVSSSDERYIEPPVDPETGEIGQTPASLTPQPAAQVERGSAAALGAGEAQSGAPASPAAPPAIDPQTWLTPKAGNGFTEDDEQFIDPAERVRFIESCRTAQVPPPLKDEIVRTATSGRTTNSKHVYKTEIEALWSAFDSKVEREPVPQYAPGEEPY